jgi:hypothetical protein
MRQRDLSLRVRNPPIPAFGRGSETDRAAAAPESMILLLLTACLTDNLGVSRRGDPQCSLVVLWLWRS